MSMKEFRELLGVQDATPKKKATSQLNAKRKLEQMTEAVDEKIYALAIDLMKKGLVKNQEQALERATKEIRESQAESTGRITNQQRYQRLGWNN